MKQLKQELKSLSAEIRSLKSNRKSLPNGYVPGLASAQWTYRHKHIAYCLLRGKTYEQIESKVREGNEPNQNLITKYIEQYKEVKDEALHIG